MAQYEYKVVPAPKRGLKARGIKGTEAMFANALATLMNETAAEGWEYQRTDSLPCEERSGFTGRVTVFQNMLVFRRALTKATATAPEPSKLAVPVDIPPATIAAPVVAREVPAQAGPVLLSPDPRIAATLTRDAPVAGAAAPRLPGASNGAQVAAE